LNFAYGRYAGLTYPEKEGWLFNLVRGQYRGKRSLTVVLKKRGGLSCVGYQQKKSQWRDVTVYLK